MNFKSIHQMIITPLALLPLVATSTAWAEGEDGGAAAQANNPLANMTAFNIQNYYIGELTGSD